MPGQEFFEVELAEEKNALDTAQEEQASKDREEPEEFEQVCCLCRRPAGVAGKMTRVQGDFYICRDCMQRMFDTINTTGFPMDDRMDFGRMPNISMINLADLQGFAPCAPKIKKKKKEEKAEPEFDIRAIPAPHKIKARLDEYIIGQEHAKKVMSVEIGRASCRERVFITV